MDLDRDGKLDVISGSWPGPLFWFARLDDGRFEERILKDKDGKPIDVGSASTPFAVDWDHDGDLDLVVGDIAGLVHLTPNESHDKALLFGKPKLLATLPEPLGDAQPVVVDWDGDRLLDLLVAHSEGGVVWYRNVGKARDPRLAKEPSELIPPSPAPWTPDPSLRPNDWGVRAKISVVDWNRDGKLDILLGDYCGSFSDSPDKTEKDLLRLREAAKRLPPLRRQWSETFSRYRSMLKAEALENRDQQLSDLRKRLLALKTEVAACQDLQAEFQPQQQAHGFVWLFLRR